MIANRYLNLSYLWHTVKLKSQSWLLSMKYGSSPFMALESGIDKGGSVVNQFKEVIPYISFNYLTYKEATSYFSGSLIHKIMSALIYCNEKGKGEEIDIKVFLSMVDAIIDLSIIEDDRLRFIYAEPYERFNLSGEYTSGIVQAKAASLFLRAYRISNDSYYLDLAERTILALLDPIEEYGTIRKVSSDMIWSEEYPSPTPSMVLNGQIFVLIALAEYLAIQENQYINDYYQRLHHATISFLPIYRQGNNILYSLYRWSFANVNYMGVYSFQFYHLYAITGQNTYLEWARHTSSLCNWKLFASIFGIQYKELKNRIGLEY